MIKTQTAHGAWITLESPIEAPHVLPTDIENLPKWLRWGPHGGPEVVYECPEQPEYTRQSGTVVVWAQLPRWIKIQINPWYYRRETDPAMARPSLTPNK